MGTAKNPEYADSLALKRLREYSELFCLDKKSGIEIAESKPHVTDAYGIPSAIGQGTHNYATIQLARYVSAIASKGNVFSLSLIEGDRRFHTYNHYRKTAAPPARSPQFHVRNASNISDWAPPCQIPRRRIRKNQPL